jgi:hypothetical protein
MTNKEITQIPKSESKKFSILCTFNVQQGISVRWMNGYNRGLDTTGLIRYRNGYYNVLRWVEYNYYVY